MQRAKRIEPRVQFQPALVRFLDGEGERVVKRLRRLAHLAGEALRPRLNRRGVKRVARRADLENDRVEMKLGRAVEQRNQFRLLLRDRQAGFGRPVLVRRDDRNPRAAKLTQHRRRRDGHRLIDFTRGKKHRGRQPDEHGQNFDSELHDIGRTDLDAVAGQLAKQICHGVGKTRSLKPVDSLHDSVTPRLISLEV